MGLEPISLATQIASGELALHYVQPIQWVLEESDLSPTTTQLMAAVLQTAVWISTQAEGKGIEPFGTSSLFNGTARFPGESS